MTPMGGIRLDVITCYIQNLPFLTNYPLKRRKSKCQHDSQALIPPLPLSPQQYPSTILYFIRKKNC